MNRGEFHSKSIDVRFGCIRTNSTILLDECYICIFRSQLCLEMFDASELAPNVVVGRKVCRYTDFLILLLTALKRRAFISNEEYAILFWSLVCLLALTFIQGILYYYHIDRMHFYFFYELSLIAAFTSLQIRKSNKKNDNVKTVS